MNRAALLRRNLAFHWRAHLAVALGVAAAGAAFTGALLVGDSMRTSLRDTALGRLANVSQVVVAPRFFREALADDLAAGKLTPAPAILLRGAVRHAATSARVNQVGILGVDDRFWALHGADAAQVAEMPRESLAILNRALADDLGAAVGDPIILSLGKPQDVSMDTLLGRRDRATTSARLTVSAIIDAADLGAFDLNPRQQTPRNLYVPLATLQRILDQPGRVNTLLAGTDLAAKVNLPGLLDARLTPADLGLNFRIDETRGYLAVESDAFLIAPALEAAVRRAAEYIAAPVEPVLAYLANAISADGRSIPYSTVAALNTNGATLARMSAAGGGELHLMPGEILLNTWAAADLGVTAGANVELEYYVTGVFGRLETQRATFTLAGIVDQAGSADDPGFTPAYPGVTDVERIADWDPPFPVELKRLRDQDERYWESHKTTPKAFLTFADGERLWTAAHAQHGRCTALRIWPAQGESATDLRERLRSAFATAITPADGGLAVLDVRAAAAEAGRGSTDFSGLFIGFSFFLIAAALMLVALLFRLGTERRAREVGLLLAAGFGPRKVTRLLLAEGAIVAAAGAVLGLFAGTAYARLMLTGLRTWWSAAVNAPFLHFAGAPRSYALGLVITAVVAVPALAWGIRTLRRVPPNRLLAGATEAGPLAPARRTSLAAAMSVLAFAAAIALIAATYVTDRVSAPLAFFGGGALMVIAGVAAAALLLRLPAATTLAASNRGSDHARTFAPSHVRTFENRGSALAALGLRNASRHGGRSLLIIALLASAIFVTTAVQAFRLAPDEDASLHGGAGGFALLAETTVPLPHDLNTPAGRDALNLSAETQDALQRAQCMPFRLRPGDAASCLNLFQAADPRILGVPCAMIHRGGFSFSASLAKSDAQRENPWRLLEGELPGGAIPVIGDEASVLWQLHSGLGKQISVTDQSGKSRQLQFVALLKGSVLQGELLIHEDHFTRLFPAIAGHAYFLIEADAESAKNLASQLEADLEPYGCDVMKTRSRLRDLFAVQNTYLSTFQLLGGLGVLLGSIGLIAVMLRNVWERRGELALMQALGFSRRALASIVLVENAVLILAGLGIGVAAALVAITPRIVDDPSAIAWGALVLLALGIPVLGIGAAALVLSAALRAPLLHALRRE